MKRAVLAALAAVFLVAASPADEAARVLAAPDPGAIDYFAVKTALGPEGYKAFSQTVTRTIIGAPGGVLTNAPCWDRRKAETMGGVLLGNLSTSAEGYAADLAEARAALARFETFKPRLTSGEEASPPYDGAAKMLKTASAEADPRKAELLRRAARDQFARHHITALWSRAGWAGPVSPNAMKYLGPVIGVDFCVVDTENLAWLKADLKANGWYKISKYGAQADNMAWLMVQHADSDRAFQREMLEILDELSAKNESSRKNYAYLYDRVAGAEKRPQRYATQGTCLPGKAWEPLPIEDPENIDKVRASVGLGPLAEYRKQFNCP